MSSFDVKSCTSWLELLDKGNRSFNTVLNFQVIASVSKCEPSWLAEVSNWGGESICVKLLGHLHISLTGWDSLNFSFWAKDRIFPWIFVILKSTRLIVLWVIVCKAKVHGVWLELGKVIFLFWLVEEVASGLAHGGKLNFVVLDRDWDIAWFVSRLLACTVLISMRRSPCILYSLNALVSRDYPLVK